MASWFDIKGTFQDYFRIGGKAKTRLDCTSPTVSRDFKFPDASVDLSGGTVGQFLSKLSATTIGWANGGGGGGGGFTEIANAGNISGSYDGNVYGAGTLTVTGNVIVKGNLYVTGKITNNGGYSITVYGDCVFASEVDFQTNTGVAAGNIDIKGNFFTGERATPYPLRNVVSGGVPFYSASPVFANSTFVTGANNYLEISTYDYSTVLTVGDYILVNGGVNAGFSRQIISLFWDGINTQVTTAAFPNVFAGDESNFTLKPNNAFLFSTSIAAYLPSSGYVTSGANIGQTETFSSEIISPDGFGYIISTTTFSSPVDYFDFSLNSDLVFTTDFNYKHLAVKNNCPSDFPSGTKLKFDSTSNNSDYIFGVRILNSNYEINLTTASPFPILDTDSFYTLDDMGMLFTWDFGAAPTITIGMNYFTVGGLLAEGRSGNLNGANIIIKGNVVATNSNSNLAGYDVFNGAKISCNGFGTGNGGNITILGKVINCSLSSYASQTLGGLLSGNGGNISIGSFEGRMITKLVDSFGIATGYGNSVLNYGGVMFQAAMNAIAGNGGDFNCDGSFYGLALINRGGCISAASVVGSGGNAGKVKVRSSLYCATFNCAAGGVDIYGPIKTGLINTVYIGGDLTSNSINISGGSSEVGGFSTNNPSYISTLSLEFLGNLIGLILSDSDDNPILASLNNNAPVNSSCRNIILSINGDIENFRYISGDLVGISMVLTGTGFSSTISCRNVKDCIIFNVRLDSPSLSAGQISISGDVHKSTLSAHCIDSDSFNKGGSGGNISILGNASLSILSVRGNEVYSTSGTTTLNSGSGGTITVNGYCYNTTLAANGGRIRHNVASTGASGAGGTITVNGYVMSNRASSTNITVAGGNRESGASAGVAGAGGTIDIQGVVNLLAPLSGKGGDNVAGSTGGSCGQLRLGSGGTTSIIDFADGAGNVPTTARNIVFNGYCNFIQWVIPSRSTVKIRSKTTLAGANDTNNPPYAYIFCTDRSGKIQLTKSSGTETTGVLASHVITFYDGTDWNTATYTGPIA